MLELAGKVKVVFDTQTFDSGFEKREFVITTSEEYPQDVKFELYKEKCDLLKDLKEGQSVKVHYNIKGNEYNGRYYVNLNAWKIDKVEVVEYNTQTETRMVNEDNEPLPF